MVNNQYRTQYVFAVACAHIRMDTASGCEIAPCIKIDKPSDFIWPFLQPYMRVIPNPKIAFIFPISCILALIFPILINISPNVKEKVASLNPK